MKCVLLSCLTRTGDNLYTVADPEGLQSTHVATHTLVTMCQEKRWLSKTVVLHFMLLGTLSKERIHIISLQPISDSFKPKSIHELYV